jgi:hypothetical protein
MRKENNDGTIYANRKKNFVLVAAVALDNLC